MNEHISGVKSRKTEQRKERKGYLSVWLCLHFRKRILQESEWMEVALEMPGAQKFERS